MNKKHIDFLLLDLICLILSFALAFYIRHHAFFIHNRMYVEMLVIMILLELIIYFFRNPFSGILRRGYLVELTETLVFDLLSMFASVMYLFIFKIGNDYSRIILVLTYIIYFVFSYLTRIAWKDVLLSKANNTDSETNKSLLIVCREKEAELIIEKLVEKYIGFYHLTGLCIVDKDLKDKKVKGYKVVANKDNLLDYVSKNWVDEIFVGADYKRIPSKIIDGLAITGIPIHFRVNDIPGLEGKTQIVEKFGPYNSITTVNRTYEDSELFLKRMMDIVGGLIGCLVTVLIAIIIGPIIYIKSPGPIIYVSDRVGKNGKIFKFYKFRSMVLNADDLKDDLRKQNRNKDGMMFKIKDDPRIIPGVGTFIRKTSIDEFPQFFNVLKGDMSLVGTRPPTLDEWNKYSPYYRSRLSVKPGITGMWQISGRSNITDFNEVVKLDNEYINNWSISLDIKILFKTVIYLFKGGNDAM